MPAISPRWRFTAAGSRIAILFPQSAIEMARQLLRNKECVGF
jgi:hypothetical protein